MDLNHIKRTFVKNSQNSGLSCLVSFLGYYHARLLDVQINVLNKEFAFDFSNFLQLNDAAKSLGFNSEGYEAELKDLKELNHPVILLVNSEKKYQHFIICYGYDGKFLIGDPSWGILQYSELELESIWTSKALLLLDPNSKLIKEEALTGAKKVLIRNLFRISKWQLSVLGVMIISSAVFVLFAIVNIKNKVNFFFQPGSITPQYQILCPFFCVLVVLISIRYFFRLIATQLITKIKAWFNNEILQKLFKQSLEHYTLYNATTAILQINNIQSITADFQNLIMLFFYNLPIILIVVIISAFLNFYFFIVFLFCLMSYAYCLWLFHKKIEFRQKETIITGNNEIIKVVEIFNTIKLIKSFQKESTFKDFINMILDRNNNFSYATSNIKNVIYFWWYLIGITSFTLLIIVAKSMFKSSFGTSEFILLILFILFIATSKDIVPATFSFYKIKAVINQIIELHICGQNKEIITNDLNIQNITVQNMNFHYPGASNILKDISIELRKGNVVALYGANGSGKSTIIEILLRNLEIESGKITVNGKPWEEISSKVLVENTAVIRQHPQFLTGTVIDNICMSKTSLEALQVIDFCNKMGFDVFIQQLPQGYYTLIDQNAARISNGHQQIIALARALYKRPKVLLLDEPSTCLDSSFRKFIETLIHRMKAEMAIMVATTDIRFAQTADFMYTLDQYMITKHYA